MICPFAAGGPLDTLGRVLGESLHRLLGQPIIVENVAGANASIGTGRVARAASGWLGVHRPYRLLSP